MDNLNELLEDFARTIYAKYQWYSTEELAKEQWNLLTAMQDPDIDPHIKALYDYIQTVIALVHVQDNNPEMIH